MACRYLTRKSSPIVLLTQSRSGVVSDANGDHTLVSWGSDLGTHIANSYLQKNISSTTLASEGQIIRPGEVKMRGGDLEDYAIATFTAPAAGGYQISAIFSGLTTTRPLGTNTVIEILQNSADIYDNSIQGFVGYPGVDVQFGSQPVVSYSGIRTLAAGDTLSFAVGGWPGDINHDTSGPETGLALTITAVPEPTSLALLGMSGMAILRRRK